MFDATLDERISEDLDVSRRRRSLFAFLSILIILSEIGTSIALLIASVRNDSHTAFLLSATSAFTITLDATLGIRERASYYHSSMALLRGIRTQLRHPSTAPLWSEYASVRASRKINYIEAACDGRCAFE